MLKTVGFFDELELSLPTGNSLIPNISNQSHPKENEIIKYLESGEIIIACAGVVEDVLSKSNEMAGVPSILTDGLYIWHGVLKYYVKEYHVILPNEFILYIEANNWKVPSFNKNQIIEISEQFSNEVW